MEISLLQYLFEVTLCLGGCHLLYRILPQRSEIDTLFFLLFAIISSTVCPLLSFSADETFRFFYSEELTQMVYQSGFASVPMSISYSGNIILTVQDIFSLIYLFGFGYFAFKKIDCWTEAQILLNQSDQLELKNANFWTGCSFFSSFFYEKDKQDFSYLNSLPKLSFIQKIPVLLIELLSLIFWFHPFITFFKNEFANKSRLFNEKLQKNAYKATHNPVFFVKTLSAIPFLFVFLGLFSFDLAEKIPFAKTLSDLDETLTTKAHVPLFDLDKSRKGTVLDWGKLDLQVAKIGEETPTTHNYTVQMMNRPYFKEMKDAELKFYYEGTKQRIVKLEAIFNSPDFAQPLRALGREEVQKYIKAVSSQREVTIILKIETEFGEKWMAALAITRYAKIYVDNPEMAYFAGHNSYFTYTLNTNNPLFLVEKASIDVEEEDAIYSVKWGDLEIILEKYANPNVYRGYVELDMETAEKNIGNTVEVLKNGSTRSITSKMFTRYDVIKKNEDSQYRMKFEEIEPTYLLTLEEENIKGYEPGTYFYMGLETEDILINSVELKIIDPFQPHIPKITAKNSLVEPAEFSFQIINVPGRKTMLKADTLLSENQRNLEMYSDRSRYDIVHLPGFKTNRRLLAAEDFIWWSDESKERENQSLIFRLLEYTEHIGQPVGLIWGDIFANTNAINLTRQDIINNQNYPLILRSNKTDLEIIEFEMIVRRGEEEPQVHFIKRKNREIRLPDLSEIDIETGVYFQKIVVKTEEGLRYFPVNFAFHVGNELSEYELFIEETEPNGVAFDTLVNEHGNFTFEWKNRDLKGILSDITRYNENYIRYFGDVKNPTLNIKYHSEKINSWNGRYLLNAELRRKYGYSYRSKFETMPSYRLGLGSESKLNTFTVSAEKEKQASDKAEINGDIAVLESATVSDLRVFLEKQYDIYIYVVADAEDAYYFSIDISSIEATTQQLEADYGLQLIYGNYPVRFIDVRFFDKSQESY